MTKQKGINNSIFTIVQTVVLAIVSVVLFKLSVNIVGLQKTGVWSYLTSINSIASFGSFGFANAIVYFLPKYSINDRYKINDLINTTLFAVFFISLFLSLLSYIIFYAIIPHTISIQSINQAFSLLPYIIVAYFFSSIAAVYVSALDGFLMFQYRAKINICAYVVYLIMGIVLLNKLGIKGLVIAQIIQNIFILIVAYLCLNKHRTEYKFSIRFNKPIFNELFSFGFNFQIISITQIISEPFMKSMITKFGGLHYTAIFDFIIKIVSISRNLLIAANQTIVPQLTIYKSLLKYTTLKVMYKANFNVIYFLSLLFFLTPLAFSDALSIFFLSEKSSLFNFILLNVSLGLLVNSFALPAHFHFLGIGQIRWNVYNNVISALLMIISAPLVGSFLPEKYIVLSWSISTMAGPILLICIMQKRYHLGTSIFYKKYNLLLLISIIVAIIVNKFLIVYLFHSNTFYINLIISILVYTSIVFLPIKHHPIITKFIHQRFRNRHR